MINLEEDIAFLNEEDQDIAHRLGLIYTPKGIMEIDALSSSDFKLHKEKLRKDEDGKINLYCDNVACQERVRNPILIIDKQTGGLYHSVTCFRKDMNVKRYLAQERKDINLEPFPTRVSLETALTMYSNGKLQQSLNPRTKNKFRSLEPWPEALVSF